MDDSDADTITAFEVTERGELRINGSTVRVPHRIKDAVAVAGLVVILYDPDASPRRHGTFPNLVAFGRDGSLVWVAETPTMTTGDCYYAIHSADPLVAYSTQSYDCEIDPGSGRLVRRTFTK